MMVTTKNWNQQIVNDIENHDMRAWLCWGVSKAKLWILWRKSGNASNWVTNSHFILKYNIGHKWTFLWLPCSVYYRMPRHSVWYLLSCQILWFILLVSPLFSIHECLYSLLAGGALEIFDGTWQICIHTNKILATFFRNE